LDKEDPGNKEVAEGEEEEGGLKANTRRWLEEVEAEIEEGEDKDANWLDEDEERGGAGEKNRHEMLEDEDEDREDAGEQKKNQMMMEDEEDPDEADFSYTGLFFSPLLPSPSSLVVPSSLLFLLPSSSPPSCCPPPHFLPSPKPPSFSSLQCQPRLSPKHQVLQNPNSGPKFHLRKFLPFLRKPRKSGNPLRK
jgi:hypothetical protein